MPRLMEYWVIRMGVNEYDAASWLIKEESKEKENSKRSKDKGHIDVDRVDKIRKDR